MLFVFCISGGGSTADGREVELCETSRAASPYGYFRVATRSSLRSASRSEQCAPEKKKGIPPLASSLRGWIAAGKKTCTILFYNDGKCGCIFSWCRRFSPAAECEAA